MYQSALQYNRTKATQSLSSLSQRQNQMYTQSNYVGVQQPTMLDTSDLIVTEQRAPSYMGAPLPASKRGASEQSYRQTQLVFQELDTPAQTNEHVNAGGMVFMNKYRPTKMGNVDQSQRQNMVHSYEYVTTPPVPQIQASQYNPDFFVSSHKPITQLGNLVQSSRQNTMLTDANNRVYGNFNEFENVSFEEGDEYEFA